MKNIRAIVAFLGAFTIMLGAFGAHSLKEVISAEMLTSFETAVRYQMYHVLLLLLLNTRVSFPEKELKKISLLFLLGILLFSGSIYAIVLGIPSSYVWFVTPIGGLTFIIGWIYLAFLFLRNDVKK